MERISFESLGKSFTFSEPESYLGVLISFCLFIYIHRACVSIKKDKVLKAVCEL